MKNSNINLLFGAAVALFINSAQADSPPPNDSLGMAIPISASTQYVLGTTTDATIDLLPEMVDNCASVAIDSPGVWYTLYGSGADITAQTCTDGGIDTYDTKISLFTINEDGGLVCHVANDDKCGLQSKMSWLSEAGQQYFLLVHGFNATGDFRLSFDAPGDLPPGQLQPRAAAVPTLSFFSLIFMSGLLTGLGVFFSRKSKVTGNE